MADPEVRISLGNNSGDVGMQAGDGAGGDVEEAGAASEEIEGIEDGDGTILEPQPRATFVE